MLILSSLVIRQRTSVCETDAFCLLSSNPNQNQNQRFKFAIIYIVSTRLVVEPTILSKFDIAKY